ncbi:MAG: HDOD domain-containing protein [Armatimonadota bacterium]
MFGRSSGKIDLPSMPAALGRIIHITNSPDTASAEEVATAVMTDQSLATKVMRLANSAYYGRKVKAENVTDAVNALGFTAVRNLAASASIVDALFPKQLFKGFSWPDMWTHSVITGIATEVIHDCMGTGSSLKESAFVAGLLHDVGKLIVARALPSRFVQIIEACREWDFEMVRAETNYLGTNHAKIGHDLSMQWEFPERLRIGIAYHHSPETAPAHEDVARAVRAANLLAKRIGKYYITNLKTEISCKQVADAAGISLNDVEYVTNQVRDRLDNFEEIISWGRGMPAAA